jgi:hypothetical protein
MSRYCGSQHGRHGEAEGKSEWMQLGLGESGNRNMRPKRHNTFNQIATPAVTFGLWGGIEGHTQSSNQSLAALANIEINLSQSQLRHSQFECGTFGDGFHSRGGRLLVGSERPGERTGLASASAIRSGPI